MPAQREDKRRKKGSVCQPCFNLQQNGQRVSSNSKENAYNEIRRGKGFRALDQRRNFIAVYFEISRILTSILRALR